MNQIRIYCNFLPGKLLKFLESARQCFSTFFLAQVKGIVHSAVNTVGCVTNLMAN